MRIADRLPSGSRGRYIAAAIAAVATLVTIGQIRDPHQTSFEWVGLTAAIALSCTAMGMLVLGGVAGHLVGRLLLATGIAATIALLAVSWTIWPPLAWLAQWVGWYCLGLLLLALLAFPDGRLASRWRWTLAIAITATTSVIALALAVATLDPPQTFLLHGQPPTTARAQVLVMVAVIALAALVLQAVAIAGTLLVSWLRATGQARQQLACVLLASALLPVSIVFDALWISGAWIVVSMLVPAAMTLAILRFGLYGLDRLINRSLVWLIMTLLVISAFVALVAMLRGIFFGSNPSTAALAATGLVAVAFQPALDRVQRGVNSLLYGDRDDPYRMVSRLGDLLGHTIEPQGVPPLIAETIARSLRVPYVAVETLGRQGSRVLAEHGTPGPEVETFDMLSHGERIGRLIVATRSPRSRFARQERRILANLALHAAVAIEATLLIQDLRESRERLVFAREEERRRLRRDLHDGLGPTIAGMSMQVRAAHQLIEAQPRAANIMEGLADDLRSCMAEVQRLVDQLRPPALDGGLAAALRTECRRFNCPDLVVTLDIQTELDGLPAAVEVAVYRVVAEALTNVSRHARASHCDIVVHKGESLVATIVDDGVGFTPAGQRGVGLTSMRERAEELGGTCVVNSEEPHGTSVSVRMPLRLDSRPVADPAVEREESCQ